MIRYGLPYLGSKNKIAEWIIDNLPYADTFCDLFFGGAITHRALLSGKYKNFIANDINGKVPKFFIECCEGKHTIKNHPKWINREEFNNLKNDDIYISLIWSFNYNGIDYMYGKHIEEFKKALHYACFYDSYELLKDLGINIPSSLINTNQPIYEKYIQLKSIINTLLNNDKNFGKLIKLEPVTNNLPIILSELTKECEDGRLENLVRLHQLETLESLSKYSKNIQIFEKDYEDVKIPNNSIIYCDIPYKSTRCGLYNNKGFDYERFYSWARKQNNIFISEYNMPDDFIEIASIEKIVNSTNNGSSITAIEKLFTNKQTFKQFEHKSSYKNNTKFFNLLK